MADTIVPRGPHDFDGMLVADTLPHGNMSFLAEKCAGVAWMSLWLIQLCLYLLGSLLIIKRVGIS